MRTGRETPRYSRSSRRRTASRQCLSRRRRPVRAEPTAPARHAMLNRLTDRARLPGPGAAAALRAPAPDRQQHRQRRHAGLRRPRHGLRARRCRRRPAQLPAARAMATQPRRSPRRAARPARRRQRRRARCSTRRRRRPTSIATRVDMDRERASFADNAIKYEATLRFINSTRANVAVGDHRPVSEERNDEHAVDLQRLGQRRERAEPAPQRRRLEPGQRRHRRRARTARPTRRARSRSRPS